MIYAFLNLFQNRRRERSVYEIREPVCGVIETEPEPPWPPEAKQTTKEPTPREPWPIAPSPWQHP